MHARLAAGALAPLILLATLASAQDVPAAPGAAPYPHDTRRAGIARAVSSAVLLSIFDDVSADLQDDRVVLAGSVTSPGKRADVERRIAGIPGVRTVHNGIRVLRTSPADDELRYRIARAIYGNPSFWNYASMPNPPIHILVEEGRVTLTGVVSSNAERALARSLATGFGEVSVTNALRTGTDAAAHRLPLAEGSFLR
jgi:hyperosmotically inducible protein